MATRAPGFNRVANPESESCLRTSAATSGIRRSVNFWRTTIRRGSDMMSNILTLWDGAIPHPARSFRRPLGFENPGVLPRCVHFEAEIRGSQDPVRLRRQVGSVQRIRITVVILQEFFREQVH